MKKIQLTKEEQRIEDSAEQLVPASKATRERVERIVERSKRNVLVHKYVTNQVLDKEEVIKMLQAAKESGAL